MTANTPMSPKSIERASMNETDTQPESSSSPIDTSIPTLYERSTLNKDNALTYLEQVKAKFSDQPDVYNRFLEITKELKRQAIDTLGVIARIYMLFRGHSELVCGFNTFLPPGYHIESIEPDLLKVSTPTGLTMMRLPQPEFNDAIRFLDKIKNRVGKEQLAETLRSYTRGEIKRSDIRSRLEPCIPDLMTELDLFLPSLKRKASNDIHEHKRVRVVESDIRSSSPNISQSEAEFFRNVRKYIGNQQTYLHFLRILNMFTQQVLDANALVDQCESYLGGNRELYDTLKMLVGYQERDRVIENVPDVSRFGNVTLSDCGPSYRSVPISWKNQSCSGRDAMCWQVLNDEYVSHPTWASEDSGFISSKKNQYEESLHRLEDERYDYDLNIDATLNVLTLLEPIAKRITNMSESEKKSFKLPPGLGGQSMTIYQRVIKKVYGKEQGEEIINMLHSNPVHTVPVVVKRLLQKNDEWKKSQRDWNKIWREVEIKNYYKALDYQSAVFKANDRKMTSIRYLVNEIDALRVDQLADHISNKPQMSFEFQDTKVLQDAIRVLFSYLDEQTLYSPEDCHKMKTFIKMFVPLFFNVTGISFSSDEEESSDDNEGDQTDEIYNFFGNIGYYCFVRLFQMCYERLGKLKQVDIDYKANGEKAKLMNEAALELNITSTVFNSIELDFKDGYYNTMLTLIDKLFSFEIDQNTYEECTRYLFGSKAFIMFTIDKLMIVLVRQLHHLVFSPHSLELWTLYRYYRTQRNKTTHAYRLQVSESLGENDHLYNLAFDTSNRTLSIQLLEKDDEAFRLDDLDRYTEYITNYTNFDIDTPNIDRKQMTRTFLTRNLSFNQDEHNVFVRSGLQYKICRNTYHMFYVINTEDAYINNKRKPNKTSHVHKSKLDAFNAL